MDRLDMELYADRLAREAERLTDELAAARLRVAWSEFEATARRRLPADDALVLEAIGVMRTTAADDDRHLIERRRRQLESLGRLQAIVEEVLARLRSG
jgi:hypothetical protein